MARDPLQGVIIDNRYRLIEKLAQGGMGSVYKGEHVFIKRVVAIKLLHRHLVNHENEEEFLKRFEREARTACQIEHPNAVTIYDFGFYKGQPYIAMQFNPGKSLKQLLKEQGPFSLERTIAIIAQVAKALSLAHGLNIVHRDLKPDNIMCSKEEDGSDRVQVLDFGLAKAVGGLDGVESTITKTGIIMGTPQYLAPEQAQGKDCDERSDIYSLGIILYQMLSGKRPFEGESSTQILIKHISEPPRPLREVNPRISSAVEAVVLKAIEKDPAKRQQNVVDLMKELLEALPQPRASLARVRVSNPSQARAHLFATVGVVTVMLLVGFGAWHWMSSSNEQKFTLILPSAQVSEELSRVNKMIRKGAIVGAETELLMALKTYPQDPHLSVKLAEVYLLERKFDQALVVAETVLQKNPLFVPARLLVAERYAQQGKHQDALTEYQEVLRLDPSEKRAKLGKENSEKALSRS